MLLTPIKVLITGLFAVAWADPLCEIEHNFDIQGQDLKNVQGSIDTCFNHCRVTQGCLAWSYNDYNGGTCWLKSGADVIIAKTNIQMGRMVTSLNGGSLYKNVDFVGNDIGCRFAFGKPRCPGKYRHLSNTVTYECRGGKLDIRLGF